MDKLENVWSFFQNLDELVYASDIETYELVYLNQKALDAFGLKSLDEIKGRKCHEVLQSCAFPCGFCNNDKLCVGRFEEWRYYNPVVERYFILKDTLIADPETKRKYRIEIAIDITEERAQDQVIQMYRNIEALANEGLRKAIATESPDESINIILEHLGKALNGERTYIFEENENGCDDNTYEWCKAGVPKEKDNLQDVPYEGIIETWFAQYQESNNVIIHDIEECKKTSEAIYERLKPQGVNTLVTGPIKINGKMVGFYGVDNPPEEKLHEISNLIDMIVFMISFMIRLRNNADVLEHSALYDQLTDCKNRKALDWAYTEKLEKYFPLAVVMCDLNGLKEINDQKGHDAGDKFIVQAAQTLKSVFGKRHVYRLGGDEFIAVLPNITHPAFQKLLETAKSQLGAIASLGTTISGTKDTDFESLLKAADAEMYENKKQYYIVTGKDRRKHSL